MQITNKSNDRMQIKIQLVKIDNPTIRCNTSAQTYFTVRLGWTQNELFSTKAKFNKFHVNMMGLPN